MAYPFSTCRASTPTQAADNAIERSGLPMTRNPNDVAQEAADPAGGEQSASHNKKIDAYQNP